MSPRVEPSSWLRWLTEGDEVARKRAQMLLGGLESEDIDDPAPLFEGLQAQDDDVIFWCLIALGRIREVGAAAAPRIREIVTGHDAFGTRQAALQALVKVAPVDPATRSAVLSCLEDDSPFVRREALQCMIAVASVADGDLDTIGALAKDTDPTVARWSEIAIRTIRSRMSNGRQGDGD
jgi:HEAT repeat protein